MATKRAPRITLQTLKTIALLLESDPHPLSGADIFNRTRMFSGTLYPILGRLEEAGWIKGEWEKIDPSKAGRPRRRLYTLTGTGRTRAKAELENLRATTGQVILPAGVTTRGAI